TLPATSITRFAMRGSCFGAVSYSRPSSKLDWVWLTGSRLTQSSGNTWNVSRISLIWWIVKVVVSAFVTLVRRAAATTRPSTSTPSSVKITPMVDPSVYHPLVSVSRLEQDNADRTFSSAWWSPSGLKSTVDSRSISTKLLPDRSVRFRSTYSARAKGTWDRIP